MLHFTARVQLRHYRRRLVHRAPPKLPMQRLDERMRPPAGPARTLALLAQRRSDD